MNCLKIELKGLVQGVGMRPFIYNLAKKFSLFGQVYNDDSGVKIFIYGDENKCNNFLEDLQKFTPTLSRIDEIKISKVNAVFSDFKIIESKQSNKIAPILPDFAICDECQKEFNNPNNRRFHHAFINCTHCGPRFSIISSLPYDRINTSMKNFAICDECQKEFTNPNNRRFHAQPISCKQCGPKTFLKDTKGRILAQNDEAFKLCAKFLQDGKIIAIKGIGGFHLCCDGTNLSIIKLLREKKSRPHKPFALMVQDLKMAQEFVNLNKNEVEILTSQLRPIVLAKKAKILDENLLNEIAPNTDKLGIFIAPSAFCLLLFYYFKKAIIATSANISSEPIITHYDEICAKLGNVCDFVLDNDREILHASDDSIVFCLQNQNEYQQQFIRLSRGLRPQILPAQNIKNYDKCVLAIGSELKNEFAIFHNNLIFHSTYNGDLKNIESFERFLSNIKMFEQIYNMKFDLIVADLHPYFVHTQYFKNLHYEILYVEHHKAHIYSVMSENNLNIKDEILGFAFDGTGYGQDGKIWGGEVFLNKNSSLNRILHFDDFKMIAGQNAIKNIYYLAFAILKKYNINAKKFFDRFSENELKNLDIAFNASNIYTSSLGRIFDALACVVLDIKQISFDAQAALMLESFYDENLDICFEFKIINDIINFKEIFEIASKENDVKIIATGFINAIAKLIVNLAQYYNKDVILSGGCFANQALLNRTIKLLRQENINFYLPKSSAGDGCIANGQLYYALNF